MDLETLGQALLLLSLAAVAAELLWEASLVWG